MALKILWGYNVFDQWSEVPLGVKVMVVIGLVALVLNVCTVLTWIVRDLTLTNRRLQRDGQLMAGAQTQAARIVNIFPLYICANAFIGLFLPGTFWGVQLSISVAASFVIGSIVHAFVHVLGRSPEKLLRRTPEKNWWFHPLCGGVNDWCWAMGFFHSRKPHRLTINDIHRAHRMVYIFIWLYNMCAVYQAYAFFFIPGEVQMSPDGFCISNSLVEARSSPYFITISVLAAWTGVAGFSIIMNAVDTAVQPRLSSSSTSLEGSSTSLGEASEQAVPDRWGTLGRIFGCRGESRDACEMREQNRTRSQRAIAAVKSYKVKQKAGASQIYLLLPLLLAVFAVLPMKSYWPIRKVPVTTEYLEEANGTWTSSGQLLRCPIFDTPTLSAMLYCLVVAVNMALLSFSNYRNFPPGNEAAVQLLKDVQEIIDAQDDLEDEEAQAGESQDAQALADTRGSNERAVLAL